MRTKSKQASVYHSILINPPWRYLCWTLECAVWQNRICFAHSNLKFPHSNLGRFFHTYFKLSDFFSFFENLFLLDLWITCLSFMHPYVTLNTFHFSEGKWIIKIIKTNYFLNIFHVKEQLITVTIGHRKNL